ncbi:MAG: fatty acid desaturase, partial [Pseudomonadota bacterium]
TRASLRRKLFRDITGQTGLKQRAQQFAFALQMAGDVDRNDPLYEQLSQNFSGPGLMKSLLANAVLLMGLTLIGVWWAYPLLWVLPLLTWYQLVLRVRNIAEHGAVGDAEDPLQNVRTTYAGPLLGFFVAPYWVNYHLEHHLVMHVPCWRLPALHRLMLEKGHGRDMEIGESYWAVLRKAASRAEPVTA